MVFPDSVLVTCDVDPDRAEFGGHPYTSRDLRWDGLAKGIRGLIDAAERAGIRDFRATWFVRADDQVEQVQGDPAWCFKEHEDLWKDLLASGHEIGWHLHLWRWQEGRWHHEHDDVEWITRMATRACRAIPTWARSHGRADASLPLRMGINHHSIETVSLAERLGIRFDCSPIPGIVDPSRDWRGSPVRPYRPSREDFRKAATSAEPGVLFIPASTYPLPFPAYLAKRLLGRKGRIAEPYLTKSPSLLGAAYRNAERTRTPQFLASCHADELLPLRGRFSLANAVRNLRSLQAGGRPFETVTQFGEETLGATRVDTGQ